MGRPRFRSKWWGFWPRGRARPGTGSRGKRGESERFLHAFDSTALEKRMLAASARVMCGNRELFELLRPARPDIVEAFCPGTLLNPQRFDDTDLRVFTFGMAHKIRVPLYRRSEEHTSE